MQIANEFTAMLDGIHPQVPQ